MDHSSTSFKRVILLVAAISILFVFSSDVRAQNSSFKRGAILEEFTGTWCPHCPPGAWALDTMQQKYGDNLVEIAWHGGITVPGPGQDPLWTKNHDTLFSFFGGTGWPEAVFNRSVLGGFGITKPEFGDIPVYVVDANNPALIPNVLKASPSVDFRIVNATYDAGGRNVNFDLDITPFDMTKMRSDDTTNYATVAVLTEDNVLETQSNSGDWDQVPAGDLEDFHEMNVVRKVAGGAVLGNKFVLGTKNPTQALPIRIHYTMAVNGAWNEANIRVKTFPQAVYPKVGKSISLDVMDAKQTGYVTGLPSTAPDMAWVVLPTSKTTIKGNTPIAIVWAGGGNVTNGKLEYTINGGSTWTTIVASTNQSPYSWTIPQTAFGTTAQIRVSDASNKNTNGLSQSFQIPAAPKPGTVTITKPVQGDVLTGGTTFAITLTETNLVAPIKFEYSLDGTSWNVIGSLITEGNTISWNVPNTVSTNATVRVTDENHVTATSGVFSIVKPIAGTINNLNLGLVNNHLDYGVPMHITWSTTGDVGTRVIVETSLDAGYSWHARDTVPSTQTSYDWTTTPTTGSFPSCFVQIAAADPDKSTIFVKSNSFQIDGIDGISANAMNGYSISNYPNPYANETTIKFELPVRSFVTIRILDELGREIDKLVTSSFDAGAHVVPFNASNLAAGVYTYTLEAGATKLVGKMSIVK